MNDQDPQQKHLLSNEQYTLLNNLAVVILPALGTLYFALAQIWGFPAAEQVVGSIVAIDAFLGVLIKVGEASYKNSGAKYSGAINITDSPETTQYSLEFNQHPEALKDMSEVTFKINPPTNPNPPVSVPITATAPK